MNVLVTGANRGIGLEFVRQYLAMGADVYAATRRTADMPRLSDQCHIIECDITDPPDISTPIDILINNAGEMGARDDFENLKPEDVEHTFQVNCLGALKMTQKVLPSMMAGSKIIFITSLMGSIADNTSGGSYPYRISKAALNMLGRSLAIDLRHRGISTAILHPGWVQTRMGGSGAIITPSESVTGMRKVIDLLDEKTSGGFYNYDGRPLPW